MKVKHLRSSFVSWEDIILTRCKKEFMFIKIKPNRKAQMSVLRKTNKTNCQTSVSHYYV